MQPWTLKDTEYVYGLSKGDLDFLSLSENGELCITIDNSRISFPDIIERIHTITGKDRVPSYTLRIPQLINRKILKFMNIFRKKITDYNYKGKLKPVYPIKVNQKKQAIQSVLDADPNYGLEAGTKSELLLVLKALRNNKNRHIMCNGVKDHEYIRIVQNAITEGYNIYVSIESIRELELVIKMIPPKHLNLLLRIKPYIDISGYWGHSSGRNSKFGFNVSDLLTILNLIKAKGIVKQLVGIHAHPGSQIENICDFHKYFKYLVGVYTQLISMGFSNLKIIDFGGGIPVNYKSNLSEDFCEKYIDGLISTIVDMVPYNHPDIIIESGRTLMAQSALVLIEPLDIHSVYPNEDINITVDLISAETEQRYNKIINYNYKTINDICIIWKKWKKYISTQLNSIIEIKNNEVITREIKNFLLKKLSSFDLSHNINCSELREILQPTHYLLGNFSVFNSIADHVMVDQYFPIIPILHLDKQPQTMIRLVDISCDSDGEASMYYTKKGNKKLYTVDGYPLTSEIPIQIDGIPHPGIEYINETYLIIPLVGAYQDIVEFDHNLIGDLPEIKLFITDHGWDISVIEDAKSIHDLLKDVGYNIDNYDNPYIDY